MIRRLVPDDFAIWLPLWKGYQTFYEADISERTTEVTWARLLDEAEPMFGALAFHDGKAIGLVHYVFHRSTWSEGNVCYLNDLFATPEMRGKGFGRALIEHVYDAARAQGCAKVYWLTHESNGTAQKLYGQVAERTGFIQYRKVL
ncbi:MAG TPA: GNAT family N-acetyltransferase [Reyranella sp.]|nr:GNAT family N-acetyltransferase [Reyranella sp.]